MKTLRDGANERYGGFRVDAVMVNLMQYAIRCRRSNVQFITRLNKRKTVWQVRYKGRHFLCVYQNGVGIISLASPESIVRHNPWLKETL